jgi:hypothetical protein
MNKNHTFFCAGRWGDLRWRWKGRKEGDGPHLQGLDEALAALHGGLADGDWACSDDPNPAHRWVVAQQLHSSVSLSPAEGRWRWEQPVCRGDDVERASQSKWCCCRLPLEIGVERNRCLNYFTTARFPARFFTAD